MANKGGGTSGSSGAQPRVDDVTGDALVFNGEIYGYR